MLEVWGWELEERREKGEENKKKEAGAKDSVLGDELSIATAQTDLVPLPLPSDTPTTLTGRSGFFSSENMSSISSKSVV